MGPAAHGTPAATSISAGATDDSMLHFTGVLNRVVRFIVLAKNHESRLTESL